MSAPILIAGVGNLFFQDDGFGLEVVRRLEAEELPPNVEVVDYGIRGLHLAYRLLEPLELLIVVDAVPRDRSPGTVYLIEPDLEQQEGLAGQSDPHGMDLRNVFSSVRAMGGVLPRVLIVGCEPQEVSEGIGLSPPVAEAVEEAVALVRDVLKRESTRAAPAGAEESGPWT